MDFSRQSEGAFNRAVAYAKKNDMEYLTPELFLLGLCGDEGFARAFSECGGQTEKLEKDLTAFLRDNMEAVKDATLAYSEQCKTMIIQAQVQAESSESQSIEIEHLLHSMWLLPDSYAVYFLTSQGVEELELLRALIDQKEESGVTVQAQKNAEADGWQAYAPCLNDTLEDVNLLIGRDEEMERMIQVLLRRDKNNPLLIGESGVGKTAITYGFVQRLRAGDVPEPLRESRVFALDLGGMLAGTQYRGEFEKRLKRVLQGIEQEEKPILFLDEVHNLAGAGAVGESSFDAGNMLKPYLADGHIRFIGATTFEEYKKYFEKNRSLARRFQNIEIPEPGEEETVRILQGLKPRYEAYHQVVYTDDALTYAVNMSAKYITERYLPDKAIDLMDEAGAWRRLHPLNVKPQTVDRDVIAQVLAKICRIPLESIQTEASDGLETLEARLLDQIYGQDEAVSQVVNAIKFSRAGLLEEDKPLASLLFVGPTGVGKTEVARTLAKELGVKLVRFDMSEYAEKHTVAKLIGAPAGYVGYDEGGLLTEAIRKHPSSVLLLDEIEKAHPDIYNVLLQVMDYATLTDNQGRKADFRNVVVIMTSNAGANRLSKPPIGFQGTHRVDTAILMEEVNRVFQPEFRNRLSRIVTFNSMDETMAGRVVDKKLRELAEQLMRKGVTLTVSDSARKLIEDHGISQLFGAREVERVIRNEVKPLFVDELLFGRLRNGGSLQLDTRDGTLIVRTGEACV